MPWRSGQAYDDYMQSAAWAQIRREALERSGWCCERCGASECLEVHHKTYENFGHEGLNDLEVVCVRCHPVADQERRDNDFLRRNPGLSRGSASKKKPKTASGNEQLPVMPSSVIRVPSRSRRRPKSTGFTPSTNVGIEALGRKYAKEMVLKDIFARVAFLTREGRTLYSDALLQRKTDQAIELGHDNDTVVKTINHGIGAGHSALSSKGIPPGEKWVFSEAAKVAEKMPRHDRKGNLIPQEKREKMARAKLRRALLDIARLAKAGDTKAQAFLSKNFSKRSRKNIMARV